MRSSKAALQDRRPPPVFQTPAWIVNILQLQSFSAFGAAGAHQERSSMQAFNLAHEAVFDPKKHVEKILGKVEHGDFTVACWEPGQISPYHCHPQATEIYFCFEGGGTMRTPDETIAVAPGAFVVHPPGELHEYENGPQRTLLFRVRYGVDMAARYLDWRAHADFIQTAQDAEYFRLNPPARVMTNLAG